MISTQPSLTKESQSFSNLVQFRCNLKVYFLNNLSGTCHKVSDIPAKLKVAFVCFFGYLLGSLRKIRKKVKINFCDLSLCEAESMTLFPPENSSKVL